jgi:hypothetical protein
MANIKINHQALRKMQREMQRSLDRNGPLRIPVVTDPVAAAAFTPMMGAVTNNYNGPVIQQTGDGNTAQLAWGNSGTVNQGQASTSQIAPGYEQLATVLADLLANLSAVGLPDEQEADVRDTIDVVMAEVVREEPDPGMIRRGRAAIKGYLSDFLSSIAQAATTEGAQIVRTAIEGLSDALPS